MKYTLTEKEINDKGYWDNYSELTGICYLTTAPNDEERTFSEEEYDQLTGKSPIKAPEKEFEGDKKELFDAIMSFKNGETDLLGLLDVAIDTSLTSKGKMFQDLKEVVEEANERSIFANDVHFINVKDLDFNAKIIEEIEYWFADVGEATYFIPNKDSYGWKNLPDVLKEYLKDKIHTNTMLYY